MCRLKNLISVVVFFAVSAFCATGFAQSGESVTPTGFQLETQLQGGMLTQEFTPSTSFMAGYRMDRLTLGLGVNYYMVKTEFGGGSEENTFTGIHVAPVLRYDLLSVDNGRSRLHILGSVGYGSLNTETSFESESASGTTVDGNGTDGSTTTTTSSQSAETTTNYVPIKVGLGGEHFLTENFAIGAEAGLKFGILTKVESNGEEADFNATLGTSYGMVKATFVF